MFEKTETATKCIPYNYELIEVNEECYNAFYRPVWRHVKKMHSLKKCCCPKKYVPYCTCECYQCRYYRKAMADMSLDELVEKTGDFKDEKSTDFSEIISASELVDALIKELSKIDKNAEMIVRMKLEGKLDKDIAEKLNLSTSTFSDRKKRLYKKAKEFFEKN